ncbi:hypothetical protein [Brachybacterium endophyticum]|uniref:hypothetical protein n=1 Tax=Brachybacterium endophyticum TaxID=2182385 RepID=UPI001F0C8CB1|nr:hypothetical protein [Brachybacterium endophyticum]
MNEDDQVRTARTVDGSAGDADYGAISAGYGGTGSPILGSRPPSRTPSARPGRS